MTANRLTIIILAAICLAAFPGCKDDDPGMIRDQAGVNSWIYARMKSDYLWAAELPVPTEAQLGMNPELFFSEVMRYRHNSDVSQYYDIYGDRFSTIVCLGDRSIYSRSGAMAEDAVYDLGFSYSAVMVVSSIMYLQVEYVIPGSPADKAGVRRGDCIYSVNGAPISSFSFSMQQLASAPTVTLHMIYPQVRDVTVSKTSYFDTPVIAHSIFDTQAGKTGYIFYAHFTAGAGDRFYGELQRVFAGFKNQGVRNLVVDLRLNGGGELTAALQLASLIAPHNSLGKPFVYKETNGNTGTPDRFTKESLLMPGEAAACNPDAQNLYFIVSDCTASASELVIHCMRPYAAGEIVLVGGLTRGKNLGGIVIRDSRYEWELHPITIRIYDRNKVSGYEAGIEPDVPYGEDNHVPLIYLSGPDPERPGDDYLIRQLGQLGDHENEVMLKKVVEIINGAAAVPIADAAAPRGADAADRSGILRVERTTARESLYEKTITY